MGRASTKENKTKYQLVREDMGLSREKASELLETIMPDRIEKIKSEKVLPHPGEVLIMADKYKSPSLCNYYCSRQCPIDQQYVPEIEIKELSSIVLEMLTMRERTNNMQLYFSGRAENRHLFCCGAALFICGFAL